ncbi:MAG: DUF4388 domain-containing protein [Nitrospirota bacterium]
MALEGPVGNFGIVDVFQRIGMQKESGMLTASCHGKEDVTLFFLNGALIRAFSGDRNQSFSDVLLLSEKITVAQMRAAFRLSSQDKSVAEALIEMNYLTVEEARHWNQVLLEEVLFDLLSWKDGAYRYEEEMVVTQNESDVEMNVEWILMEGMRQLDEWPLLLRKIPSREIVYEITERPNDAMDLLSDTEREENILQLVNGERTVNEIVNRAGVGAFPVYKTLSDLLSAGRVKRYEPKAKKTRILPEISLDLAKRLLFNPVVYNGALIILTIGIASVFFYFVLFQKKPVFQSKQIRLFKVLTSVNEKDTIEFALSLYYLDQNRYPNSLAELKKGHFLGHDISLEDWGYQGNRKGFMLERKDSVLNN